MNRWRCPDCGYLHEGEVLPDICPVCGLNGRLFEMAVDSSGGIEAQAVGQVIVIGNGAAGLEAGRTIREKSPNTRVIIFSDEPYQFYSRIHLSSFIGDEIEQSRLLIFDNAWYENQKIQVNLNLPVHTIFPARHEIKDANGNLHKYDRLVIATGARPLFPNIKGIGKENVVQLRTMADALEIVRRRENIRQAVVIGGGILGIEAASNLQSKGIEVTVVEIAPRLMPLQLDETASDVLQAALENKGIQFRLNSQVEEIHGDQAVSGVKIHRFSRESSPQQDDIPAQMVLVSIGISPNTGLAQDAGIQVNRGIVVNEFMQTSAPDIFAAGDVAEYHGVVYGIWPAAVEQGTVAATNVLGEQAVYSGTLPLNILKVAGIDLTSIGKKYSDAPDEHEIVFHSFKDGQYVKLIHNGAQLKGAIVLGVQGVGFRLEKLMRKQTNISQLLPDLSAGNWSVLRKKKK